MSKIKKIQVKRLDQKIGHNPTPSLITHNHSLSYLNYSNDKQDLYSESPYAQKLSKLRSSSTLKDIQITHTPEFLSPPQNPKLVSNLKQSLSQPSPFIQSIKPNPDHQSRLKRKHIIRENKSFDCQSFQIESKLDELLSSQKEFPLSNEIFDKIQDTFEEVISKDKVFAIALRKIKAAYEHWINSRIKPISQNSKLKSELAECKQKLVGEEEEIKRLHKKIQKISRENVELGRSLDERDTDCRTLQEHLLKITNIDVSEVPHDKTSWKVLIAENKSYSEVCKSLKKKVKKMKVTKKKLMRLLWTLKQKGFPVEETYELLNNKKNQKSTFKIPKENQNLEFINTEPSQSKSKPKNIPDLNMQKLEPNSFTEEQDSSSNYSELSFSN